MPSADDSEIARELEWCEGVAAGLDLASRHDLDQSARAATAALRTAIDSATDAYRAVRIEIRKHESSGSERGLPDTSQRKLELHARLLLLIAKRGRLELKLANDRSASDWGDAVFQRIASGEAIVNRVTDTLVNS